MNSFGNLEKAFKRTGSKFGQYRLVNIWYIEAPLETVCDAIYHSLSWPQWWLNVVEVKEIASGDAQGIGSVRRYTWRGYFPYRFTFDICVIHFASPGIHRGHCQRGCGRTRPLVIYH